MASPLKRARGPRVSARPAPEGAHRRAEEEKDAHLGLPPTGAADLVRKPCLGQGPGCCCRSPSRACPCQCWLQIFGLKGTAARLRAGWLRSPWGWRHCRRALSHQGRGAGSHCDADPSTRSALQGSPVHSSSRSRRSVVEFFLISIPQPHHFVFQEIG